VEVEGGMGRGLCVEGRGGAEGKRAGQGSDVM
jgi:hypothetical protein